jgi:pimeloyl-ACP methyl ester carboxylesterase
MTEAAADIVPGASDGISYIATDGGTKVPLVMLHGIGSNARSFAALMKAIGGGTRMIAWDAPGYGASEPLDMDWPDAGDYAASLAALLDRLHVGPQIDLLGHSMGALIAGRFAVEYADRVRSLILASPALGYRTRPGEPLAPPAAGRLEGMISEGAEAFAASRGPRLVAQPDTRHAVVADVVSAMAQVKLPGYRQSSRMLSCADLIGDAANIRCRTLVVVGDRDDVTPPANCRRVHEALMRATAQLNHEFLLIDGCGHAVVQEDPAAAATAIAAFTARIGG